MQICTEILRMVCKEQGAHNLADSKIRQNKANTLNTMLKIQSKQIRNKRQKSGKDTFFGRSHPEAGMNNVPSLRPWWLRQWITKYLGCIPLKDRIQ